MDREVLRTGDTALVSFRFVYRPEFIKPGMRLVLREGRCKGIGIVDSCYADASFTKETVFPKRAIAPKATLPEAAAAATIPDAAAAARPISEAILCAASASETVSTTSAKTTDPACTASAALKPPSSTPSVCVRVQETSFPAAAAASR
jgi:hypothetical protein